MIYDGAVKVCCLLQIYIGLLGMMKMSVHSGGTFKRHYDGAVKVCCLLQIYYIGFLGMMKMSVRSGDTALNGQVVRT